MSKPLHGFGYPMVYAEDGPATKGQGRILSTPVASEDASGGGGPDRAAPRHTREGEKMPFDIVADREAAVWPKRTWDYHGPVEDQASMVRSGHGTLRESFDLFMRLPAAAAMPEPVRGALRTRGYSVPVKRCNREEW